MKTHINNMCKSAAMGLHRIGKIILFLDRSTTEKTRARIYIQSLRL